MSWMNHLYYPEKYAKEEIEKVSKCYELSRIDDDIGYAKRFLADLEKAQKACQEFLSAAYYHRGHVYETQFRYQVYYRRYPTWRGKVEYYTGVYKIPCIPNDEAHKHSIESKRWQGKERHLAKKEADELSKT